MTPIAHHNTLLVVVGLAFLLYPTIEVFGIQQKALTTTPSSSALFPILFESPQVLVVRKPHNISHHDASSSASVTSDEDGDFVTPGVLRLLRNERKRQAEEAGERLYGVHRLDKVTSGILVLAKDASTASALSNLFARGEIQKVYFGLSAKKPQKKKQGLVQGGMARSRNKSWKLVRPPKGDKRKNGRLENFAKTRFFTTGIQGTADPNALEFFEETADAKTVAMFRPYTGRTHQLRVAAKAMGIPLLGDPIYKDGSESDPEASTTRTMLHAAGIHIPEFHDHPEINVWCPPTFFYDSDERHNGGESVGSSSFQKRKLMADCLDVAVEKLMNKHCDVTGILEAMLLQQRV